MHPQAKKSELPRLRVALSRNLGLANFVNAFQMPCLCWCSLPGTRAGARPRWRRLVLVLVTVAVQAPVAVFVTTTRNGAGSPAQALATTAANEDGRKHDASTTIQHQHGF